MSRKSQRTANPRPLRIEDLAGSLSLLQIYLIWNKDRYEYPVILDSSGEHSGNELLCEIINAAQSLLVCGVSCGDGIAIAMSNSLETTSLVFAADAIGVEVYLFDPTDIDAAISKAKSYKARMVFAGELSAPDLIRDLHSGGAYSYKYFIQKGFGYTEDVSEVFDKYARYAKPLIFLGTSGSTSEPKMQAFTNTAIYRTMVCALYSTRIDNRDLEHRRLMTLLSIRLPFGFMTGIIPILWGQEVVYASGIKPEDIARYYRYKPSIIFGTPALLQGMMALTPKDADLSSMIVFCSSGMPTPPELEQKGKAFFEAHGAKSKLWKNYGFGESFGMGTAFNPPSDTEVEEFLTSAAKAIPKEVFATADDWSAGVLELAAKALRENEIESIPPEGSCGRIYVGLNGRVLRDNGRMYKSGKGELVCRPLGLMTEYINNPKANENAFIEVGGKRYFRTGDIVRIDDDGWVFHLGRNSRFYHTVGAPDKVSCDLVERQLEQLPFIEQTVIVPSPDEELGMIGVAFLVLKPGTFEANIKERIYFEAGQKLALQLWQLPHKVMPIGKIPVAKSGKTDYATLKEMAAH